MNPQEFEQFLGKGMAYEEFIKLALDARGYVAVINQPPNPNDILRLGDFFDIALELADKYGDGVQPIVALPMEGNVFQARLLIVEDGCIDVGHMKCILLRGPAVLPPSSDTSGLIISS